MRLTGWLWPQVCFSIGPISGGESARLSRMSGLRLAGCGRRPGQDFGGIAPKSSATLCGKLVFPAFAATFDKKYLGGAVEKLEGWGSDVVYRDSHNDWKLEPSLYTLIITMYIFVFMLSLSSRLF